MARPLKEGLDYFSVDIDFEQDDKLSVPMAKYGMIGLGIIIKLMMEVYRNGYYYAWGEREQYVFTNKINVDINTVKDFVNECIKWGFFNQKLYDAFGILTSKGFQKRYIVASKRRKSINFIDIYTLIDLQEAAEEVSRPIHVVDTDGKVVNVYINPDKAGKMPAESAQSKGKEIESKKKEERESNEYSPEPPPADQDVPPLPDDEDEGEGKNEPKYGSESTYYKMALYFKEKIDVMAEGEGLGHLTKRTNLQTWADDFRKLVELDGQRDKELIRKVMDWVVKDEFWRSNVLSAGKFRDQFPKLVLEMRKKRKGSGNGTGSSGKQPIEIVQAQPADKDEVSEEEVRQLMELAERMKAGST